MSSRNPLHPIPHPPQLPLLGNLLSLDASRPMQSMQALAQQLGPIYWLKMPGTKLVVVTSAALAEEVCDTTRFDKCTIGTLRRLRPLSHGLFTSDTKERTWAKPHGILMPNFTQKAMRGYHPMMLDIAQQLVAKWARLNADDEVDVVRDMTALTLDTIGLCGFGYRFNSFYREGFHPFVDALTRSLETVQRRRGIPLEHWRLRRQMAQMDRDVAYMHGMVEAIVRERRASGLGLAEMPDLLSYMLAGEDKASGERLDDREIRDECIEFLIAGHETTSNLLSFALVELMRHPEVLARARAEVDEVFGTDTAAWPDHAQVNQLPYVQQVLKETLRLYPPAPGIGLQARADTTIGGAMAYPVPRRSLVILNTLALHRDRAVWGPDPEAFDPGRFTRAAEAARPAHAWKPFGNGQRACIGRQFAMQEATLVLGLILQRFELIDPGHYQLRIREALTIKPEGLRIRVRARRAVQPVVAPVVRADALGPGGAMGAGAAAAGATSVAPHAPVHPVAPVAPAGTALLVLHGSNGGTAEDIAGQLADAGRARGLAVTVAPLDTHASALPGTLAQGGLLLLVSASYNGTPPDNARAFCAALARPAAADALTGLRYAVFGCGNRDWSSTYQAVPRQIDEALAARGAQRLLPRGEGDAREDLEADFQAWAAALWPAVAAACGGGVSGEASGEGSGAAPGADHTTAPLPDPLVLHWLPAAAAPAASRLPGALPLTLHVNRELQQPGAQGQPPARSTRHIEFALPPGAAAPWQVGDHLALMPRNPDALVQRVLQRLGLDGDARLQLAPPAPGARRWPHLPYADQGAAAGQALPLHQLLAEALELQAPATRRQLQLLAAHTRCPHTGAQMAALAAAWQAAPDAPRPSLLQLLERWPACEAPLAALLPLWPALAPRLYSVASSPVVDAQRVALTVSVVDAPSRHDPAQRHRGVCSGQLQQAQPGERWWGRLQRGAPGFTLPDDPAVPLLMVAAGSGIAPFRGFAQQRAALQAAGARLGPALLLFGCRQPQVDALYADELQAWADLGVLQVLYAHSRLGPEPVYVQHLLARQAQAVWALLQHADARVYVCGDGAQMEPAVRAALQAMARQHGAPDDWLAGLQRGQRYLLDVWAGG
ncbi:bifunctional cytochrome P450/NADPH--P450 reductase [Aquabacterium sp. OR-4]|uniref:bifunctional cytochrome P450/NADPH--P450 reductase n=1 Tax=Aquabacterium sp. OR-4 TaxID=2978127 RepID=UPI0028C8E42C|nr:cytochrome P450 [Aquabacterium sp. OR-4]MDT7838199.1 cytochrome P450 [Aquabacterium sp. OR-4]